MIENFVSDLLTEVKFLFSAEQLTILNDILLLKLNDYELKERKTEVLSSDDASAAILNQFLSVKAIEGKSEKTLKRYRDINIMMIDYIQKPISQITTSDLRYYLMIYKTTRKVCNRTLDGMRRCFCSFFSWLSSEMVIPRNPCLGLSQIKYAKTIKKPFTPVEMELLKQSCDNTRDIALIEFLYSSGCRVSEIIGLDRNSINFASRDAIVLGKGNKERTIYLSPVSIMRLEDYLSSRTDNNSCLFASLKSPHRRLSKAGIEQVLKKLGTKSGVNKVHPHRYRRTLATNLLNRGANIQDVATILGHADLKTTQIYCYINQSNVRASFEKHLT